MLDPGKQQRALERGQHERRELPGFLTGHPAIPEMPFQDISP